MTPEKREKLKAIRQKMSNLSEAEKQVITSRGMTATVEGRVLSLKNSILVHLQLSDPSIVGGYQQWRKAGRNVRKGEHGATIFFPVGNKGDNGDLLEAETFYMGTVFDIGQTELVSGKSVADHE